MDRIDLMNAFVTVAREGSFTRAADKLGMSNQLVSKYVSQFEEQLGVRLFNRTTRKVHLTEAGEECFQHAKHILESFDDMEGQFGQMHGEPKGVIRISAPVSFATLHLSCLLRDFKKRYPAIGIDLQLNDRKVDVVEEGFDVALRIGYLKSSSMIAKALVPVRLVLCASPAYIAQHGMPSHPQDLHNHHFLRYSYMDYSQSDEPLMEVLKTRQHKQEAPFVSNNGEVLMEAAIAGEGFVLQPTFIVGKALQEGKLIQMLPEYEPKPTALYAVYPHRKLLANKLRAFIDFVADYYGTPPYWDAFDR